MCVVRLKKCGIYRWTILLQVSHKWSCIGIYWSRTTWRKMCVWRAPSPTFH
jgi:hypothetical protein